MQGDGIHIRALAPDKHRCIAALWRRSWIAANSSYATVEPLDHWYGRVATEFVGPNEALVAEYGAKIGAFVVFNRDEAYVAQLFADVDMQGKGLGRALLDAVSRQLPDGWFLHVASVNLRAQRFYETYGLVRGALDHHPVSGRERVAYHHFPLARVPR